MASGLKSQVMFAEESSYATYSTVSSAIRAKQYNVGRTATRPTGEGIAAGRPGLYAGHLVETSEGATASIEFDVQNRGLGKLWRAFFGSFATPSILNTASGVYQQTHSLQADTTQSLSIQVGAPLGATSSTVVPLTVVGAVPTQLDLSCDVTGVLSATMQFDAREYQTTRSLAVASYPATNVFHGKQMNLRIGTYGSESAVSGVTSVNLSFVRPRDVDKRYANGGGKKGFPGMNGPVEITGSITMDYLDTSSAQQRWLDLSQFSLVWEFVSLTTISTSSERETFQVVLDGCYFIDSQGQQVSGRDALSGEWAFAWRDNETNLPYVRIINTESSL